MLIVQRVSCRIGKRSSWPSLRFCFKPPRPSAVDATAALREAGARYLKGEFPEAESAYRQALAADPQSWRCAARHGQMPDCSGTPREALPFLEQILIRKPGDRDARRELGHAYSTGNAFPRRSRPSKNSWIRIRVTRKASTTRAV